MKFLKLMLLTGFIFLQSCKEEQPVTIIKADSGITTFYLIRHAEKDRTNPDDVDPELNQKGLGRAMHWAEVLKDANIDAIYSTDYFRTSMTAAPISVKNNIDVQYYDPRTLNIDQLKTDNLNKNILIVGHSNTTPQMVNMLLGEEKYEALDDSENGALFIVKIVNNVATDSKLTFNCNCPD
ncbi:SixA phosphatase family protein [Maribacter chungangensis]|jgi:broad specificity phosphatase PhoE|uniref:SixA phosphatase family protein n=1 Tax=Maribacter chungangensis TaxID=1069117 RepID=A0ABW3B4V6_9FLAO